MKRTVLSIAFILASAFIAVGKESPTIVNIVNFIRQTEPRTYTGITDEELYQTVVEQIDLQKKYNFKATYLLQYDALINPLYQELLKNGVPEGTEIGGWFEITQPHVEAAGIEWRGRFSWDWAAEVDFSFGYTPQERERLVDVYMEKFKSIFGYYPKSVGSWFIDAHTLNYMYEKYGIVASCNCKDQYGTDGYTLWGGYWNQAYYPSRVNAYMPAQDADKQIPVPVFRMLGSDPIYQYDTGLEDHDQGCVITLEPVWGGERGGGLNRQWVNWFMNMMADGDCLAFNYLQAGQENSFSWAKMHEGLEMQFPLIKELADAGKFRVETLSESGEWFKNNFKTTPATAVTALEDWRGLGHKTIWYDSRFYRANLFWEGDSFRFRDIHIFNQDMKSDFMDSVVRSNQFVYSTLSIVDGFVWSQANALAGLRAVTFDKDGNSCPTTVSEPSCKARKGVYTVECGTSAGKLTIRMKEDRIIVKMKGCKEPWALELSVAEGTELPFRGFSPANAMHAEYRNFKYGFLLGKGHFTDGPAANIPWRIIPRHNRTVTMVFN